MTGPGGLATLRRAFARQVLANAGLQDARLEKALAAVPREDFLGPGPWPIVEQGQYRVTPDADPTRLYCDALVGMVPEKGLNTGVPSFVMALIALADPRPGDRAVHVGAGRGYYSAVLAELVGPSGRVIAIEYEPALADAARTALAPWPQAQLVPGDGTRLSLPEAEIVLVNAGATGPAPSWLDALAEGGRLILPLTARFRSPDGTQQSEGIVFRIERHSSGFAAARSMATAIYPCHGARDGAEEAALAAALQRGGAERVCALYRGDDPPAERCWLRGDGWALLTA